MKNKEELPQWLNHYHIRRIDAYEMLKAICTVPNVWAFCLNWQTTKPKTFNKFMEMCAWFREDDSYLSHKVTATEFKWNKRLKKDVLIGSGVIEGFVTCWDEDGKTWYRELAQNLSEPREKHE